MPLPTLSKTWQHSVNQRVTYQGTVGATNKRVARTIKNLMVGFATNPWSVRGSSNSTAAGMDNTDRWSSDTDIVNNNAGSAHSWVVLRQTGIATNFEMCLDLNVSGANVNSASVIVSPSAGFTGGSTTARPTATDEIVMISGGNWAGDLNLVAMDVVLHAQQSTDGQCTRVQSWCNNVQTGLWIFDKPNGPVTGWTNPSVTFARGDTANNAGNDNNLFTNQLARGRGSATFNIGFTIESGTTSARASTFLNSANDFDSTYPMFPMGIISNTASHRGRHGSMFDLWGGLIIVADKDTYPNDTSRQFVQFGELIFPWNGSVPETV